MTLFWLHIFRSLIPGSIPMWFMASMTSYVIGIGWTMHWVVISSCIKSMTLCLFWTSKAGLNKLHPLSVPLWCFLVWVYGWLAHMSQSPSCNLGHTLHALLWWSCVDLSWLKYHHLQEKTFRLLVCTLPRYQIIMDGKLQNKSRWYTACISFFIIKKFSCQKWIHVLLLKCTPQNSVPGHMVSQ